MGTRILLADDQRMIRLILRCMLEKQPDIEVVGEAENGQKALELVRELLPEIVIMDISMPKLNGADATRQIKRQFPQVKIIALSTHSSSFYVAEILRAGASGYVLKECIFDELVEAIERVSQGSTYLSSKIKDLKVSDYVKPLAGH